MPVLPADIRTIHPEISDPPYTDPMVQLFIDRAGRNINATQWGSRADDAQIELACHMLIQAAANGAATPAAPVSESVGSVSASYGSSVEELRNDTELSATSYGRTYLQMRRTIVPLRVCF